VQHLDIQDPTVLHRILWPGSSQPVTSRGAGASQIPGSTQSGRHTHLRVQPVPLLLDAAAAGAGALLLLRLELVNQLGGLSTRSRDALGFRRVPQLLQVAQLTVRGRALQRREGVADNARGMSGRGGSSGPQGYQAGRGLARFLT
jgi:hypothetical protein